MTQRFECTFEDVRAFILLDLPISHTVATSVFFFSSRRRNTRLVSDWSSDVCSSDLRGAGGSSSLGFGPSGGQGTQPRPTAAPAGTASVDGAPLGRLDQSLNLVVGEPGEPAVLGGDRSGERSVGRCRGDGGARAVGGL